jgi:hypothetical protein
MRRPPRPLPSRPAALRAALAALSLLVTAFASPAAAQGAAGTGGPPRWGVQERSPALATLEARRTALRGRPVDGRADTMRVACLGRCVDLRSGQPSTADSVLLRVERFPGIRGLGPAAFRGGIYAVARYVLLDRSVRPEAMPAVATGDTIVQWAGREAETGNLVVQLTNQSRATAPKARGTLVRCPMPTGARAQARWRVPADSAHAGCTFAPVAAGPTSLVVPAAFTRATGAHAGRARLQGFIEAWFTCADGCCSGGSMAFF